MISFKQISLLFAVIVASIFSVVWLQERVTSYPVHEPQTGILWRIEKPGMPPNFLLGTVHSNDKRVLALPGKILQHFDTASSFTAEIPMTHDSMRLFSTSMFFKNDNKLKNVLDADVFKKCMVYLQQLGVNEQIAKKLKPWAVIVTLSTPPGNGENVLDQHLYNIAMQGGKPVYGLETAEEQLNYFDTLEMKIQINMLKDMLEEYEKYPRLVEQMIQAWLQRDLSAIEHLNEKQMAKGDPQLAKLFKARFIVDRNILMLQRMQPRLQEGNAFIAVGALHLPGEHGLLSLLRQHGFHVTAIY